MTVDCLNAERVAAFRSALLEGPRGPSMPGWIHLGHVDDAQPRLVFQPVPEPRWCKVRPHLDVAVDDITTGITQVLALGGGETGERHEYAEGVFVIMTDPEGHEFCLSQFY
ncbi:conserved hypothetical protein [Streptomyces sp. SPB78]|nr:conserved hypothetical protein [Streptomyces sp. SPB78]